MSVPALRRLKIVEVTNVDFSLRHFLLPLMREIAGRGHDVLGVSADGPLLEDARAEGLRVEPLPLARSLNPAAQLRALLAMRRLLRRERPDILHAHMPISGFVARLAARLTGTPFVAYTCHGFLFNQPAPWRRRALAVVIEWLGGRMTDLFMTVSTEEAADARRLRIASRPVPIGNGRDPARFHPDPSARARIRAELGTPDATPVVLAVSRLVRHKGYPELLAAMAAVPDAEFWVVGERLPSDHGEDLEPAFARAQADEAVGPRLKRLGYRTDVAQILAAADIFALPSHFEGLPMVVIEAMLTGLPVVATNIRGPREQVVHGVTGLLVPPATVEPLAEALARLTADPELRARLGNAGRARALAHYTEADVVAHTLDLLGIHPISGLIEQEPRPCSSP